MKVLLAGIVPFWLVLLVFLLAVGATWWVYRRCHLHRPWNTILPLVRITAYALMLMTLLQPVLAKIWQTTVRGRIPVIVDTSGSMSITDAYSGDEQIRAAWLLRLFEREIRNRAPDEMMAEMPATADQLDEILADLDAARRDHNPKDDTSPARLKRSLKKIRKRCEAAQDDVDDASQALSRDLDDSSYLVAAAAPTELRGHANYEFYGDIEGWEVANLTAHAKFPDQPDRTSRVAGLMLPANVGDRYGARLRGLLHPPEDGLYVFQIAADDQAQLFLGSGPDAASKRQIATTAKWTEPGDYSAQPEQTSAPIQLKQDGAYYIEVLFKENSGSDHGSVAWKLPNGERQDPVPGKVLSPVTVPVELEGFLAARREALDRLSAIDQAFEAVAGQLEHLVDKDAAPVTPEQFETLRAALKGLVEQWAAVTPQLGRLQTAADLALASAGIPAVDAALKALATMTRVELARACLTDGPLRTAELNDLGEVDLLSLGEPVDPSRVGRDAIDPDWFDASLNSTRIGSVVQAVLNFYGQQPIAAVLLLSDGNNNSGKSLTEARQFLADRDVPLLAVGMGRTQPPPDVSIAEVIAPQTVFKDDRVNINVVIRRPGYEQVAIPLEIFHNDKPVARHEIPAGTDDRVTVAMSFPASVEGMSHYEVRAAAMSGEALADNNHRTFTINVFSDPIQALLVDEFPRWESRYANMMLKRDPRISVNTLFIASMPEDTDFRGAGGFPTTREELFRYQIVILGDVDPQHFSAPQFDALRAFVVERGGTLLLMAGAAHMPHSYRNTALEDIFPFRIQPRPLGRTTTAAEDAEPYRQWRLSLTDVGLHDSAVQVAATPDRSAELWERLPALNWIEPGVFPRQHTEVLAETKRDGHLAVVTGLSGLGKVMYLGTDSFWRWRYRARWTYHHRLWSQILLWATMGRTTGSDEYVKLMTDRPEYSPGETITLKARVIGTDGQAIPDGSVSAQIIGQDGEPVKSVRFTYLPSSGGEYRAVVKDLERGRYRVVPAVTELEDVAIDADYTFEVRDLPTSEYIELALDDMALRDLSDEYRHFLDADGLLEKIPEVAVKEEHRQEIEIWNSFWLLALVAALLGFEWHMRKQQHLI